MTKKKTEFQMHKSRMAKLEHKLKMAEEARKKKKKGGTENYMQLLSLKVQQK